MTQEGREVKQVIVIRRDLGMRRGKEIAQGAHAAMAWLSRRLEYEPAYVSLLKGRGRVIPARVRLSEPEAAWLRGAFTKVTCQVDSLAALQDLVVTAQNAGVQAHVITDAGRTEFGGVPTVTALAVGPDWADAVDEVTGNLKLY